MSQSILQLDSISKAFGVKQVLTDISLHILAGERAVLVGENGAGKTTLARIILQQEQADSGDVTLNGRVGYLPQEVLSADDLSIEAYIGQALGDLHQMQNRLQTLEAQMANPDADLDSVLAEYGTLQTAFEQRGGYTLAHRLEQVMAGLGIDYLDAARRMQTLSGGEKTRVALAALLLQNPDLLILDEPTNHLDFAALEWLEGYLCGYDRGVLLISHDRRFINAVATQIVELSALTHQATIYHGNYDAYVQQKQQQYQAQVDAFYDQRQQIQTLRRAIKQTTHNVSKRNNKDHREPDKFMRYKMEQTAQATRSKKIQDASKRLERLEDDKLTHPGRLWRVAFDFDPQPMPSEYALRLDNLSMAIGQRVLFRDVNVAVESGERIIIVAPNGTGKTTLLRIILGMQAPTTGNVVLAPNVIPGYLDQEAETLALQADVWQAIRRESDLPPDELQALLHRCGLFSTDWLDGKRIGELSVGMRRKLILATLIARQANLLLLDEPTNHLDFPAIEALESGLQAFAGTVIAVSHDRWLIDRLATQVWQLDGAGLTIEKRAMQVSG